MLPIWLLMFLLFFQNQSVLALSLDDILERMAEDKEHSPFVVGLSNSENHPQYPSLVRFAEAHTTQVEWVKSVSESVLKLPFHPDRMRIRKSDEFDGWFDEYTNPNIIYLHQEAALIILVHELRHALQLGTHEQISGSWFDRALQINKKRVIDFQTRLRSVPMSAAMRHKLRKLSQRLIETCSEISAHQGDLMLALTFHQPQSKTYRKYIGEYLLEFKNAARLLKSSKISRSELFIAELESSLEKFMQEHELKK